MTILEFNELDLENRSEVLWGLGSFLGKSNNPDPKVVLFSLFNFLAEMHFSDDGSEVLSIIATEVSIRT